MASAALILGGAALGQGADDCSNAQSISGLGPHFFDNTSATLDGPSDCNGKPSRKDVWFRWTAPQSGGYLIDTCGTSSMAMRIMVYDDQACPVSTPPLVCTATGCNAFFGARMSFPTVANQSYLIRLGAKQVGDSGSGTFKFTYDDCWNFIPDPFEDNDDCSSATPMDNGSYPGLNVHKLDPDWYSMDVADGGTVTCDVFFSNSLGDIDIYLFDGCGGTQLVVGGSADDNETVSWLNDTGACVRVYLKVEHWGPDQAAECNTYDMQIAGVDPPGSCGDCGTVYCDTNPNQEGLLGISTCSLSGLPILEMTASANGQFAYHIVGSGTGIITDPPGAIGDLCLGGAQIGRYNADVGAVVGGSFATDLINGVTGGGAGNLPNPPGGALTAGQTWNFQTWVRVSGSSRFSPGLSVTFTP